MTVDLSPNQNFGKGRKLKVQNEVNFFLVLEFSAALYKNFQKWSKQPLTGSVQAPFLLQGRFLLSSKPTQSYFSPPTITSDLRDTVKICHDWLRSRSQ